MVSRIKKYWFITGLALVFSLVLLDSTGILTSIGKWLKSHRGTDIVMFLIFLGSGLVLDTRRLRADAKDLKGLAAALVLIFICAPILAFLLGKTPLSHGIIIGFFIVSVAPTTLSSGVVMTAAAGGNTAHALLVTLLANVLSVATVPLTLPLLLIGLSENTTVVIDQRAMVIKIVSLVLIPLVIGLLFRKALKLPPNRPASSLQIFNQLLILLMVFVGLSQARDSLFSEGFRVGEIVLLVAAFHGAMLLTALFFGRCLRLPPSLKKSVLFMGSQKTLPLTLMIQVSAFSGYPLALVVCVMHHLTQLFMDGYLVGRLGYINSDSGGDII